MNHKIKNLIGLLLLLVVSNVQAQWCGTPQDDAFMQDLIANKADWNRTVDRGRVDRFVPITFHLVGNNAGSGRLSEEQLNKTMCLLNDRYEKAGVATYFYIAGINEISNEDIYNNPRENGGAIRSYKDRNSMNIFVVNQISVRDDNGNLISGNILGYYTPGNLNDFIIMQKANMGDIGYTLEHEIGHFFTLAHTHRGWEDAGWEPNVYDEQIDFLSIGSSQTANQILVELVDRENGNCEIAADNICDTPADYGRGFTCGCCVLNEVIRDRNGDTLAPMMNNIMSYSGNCATWEFSPDQVVAIQTSFDANNRSYLRVEEVTQYEPITENVTYVFPSAGEVVPVYDKVTLDWEDVPNAEYYDVNVKGIITRTTESELTLTDLAPNETFIIWGVKSYNKFGGGCTEYKELFFDVGDQQDDTAVSDLSFVSGISIYPNPVLNKQDITVSFQAEKNFDAVISIYDLNGKLVYEATQVKFNQGPNKEIIPAQLLSSGIHIMEIKTEAGSITEKLIVE